VSKGNLFTAKLNSECSHGTQRDNQTATPRKWRLKMALEQMALLCF